MIKISKKLQITLVFQRKIAYNNNVVIICNNRMKRNKYIGCLLVIVLIYVGTLSGCGRQEEGFYDISGKEDDKGISGNGSNEVRAAASYADADGERAAPPHNNAEEERAAASQDNIKGEKTTSPAHSEENVPISGSAARQDTDAGALPSCYIHICGAVMHPGVYEVPAGSRLYEVIVLAGGMRADACDYLVNQAQTVSDGMQIYIPAVSEVQGEGNNRAAAAVPELTAGPEAESRDIRVNINSAAKEQLMTLPGIGETRAQAILDYRRENGGFTAIEDLMKVSGIKQGVYDRLKDLIKVQADGKESVGC